MAHEERGKSAARSVVAPEPPSLGFRDRFIRNRRATHLAYRIVVGVLGALVIVIGIIMLPLPGPGWLVIFFGLAILASEFEWAERLLRYARDKVLSWTHWVNRQPIPVRLAIGLACAAIVVGALIAYMTVFGIPGWLPESTQNLLDDIVP